MAVLGITTLLATACSHTAPEPGRQDQHSAGASGTSSSTAALPVDVYDVCARFAAAALSSDTAIDRGPADARKRAAGQWGTAELVDRLGGEGRDTTWDLLAAHRARVQVDTSPVGDDPPPPRDGKAGAGVQARKVAVAADGWRQELPGTVVYCSLIRDDVGTWKVSAVSFADSTSSEAGR